MTDDNIFHPVALFKDLGLRNSVLKGLSDAGYVQPTDIQAKLIPLILSGSDVIGQAKTGTGKTAAFSLPLLQLLQKNIPIQALILVPTRELTIQVVGEINKLGIHTPINALAIYGGQNINTQIDALKKNPQIIVGTPGRVMDLNQRRNLPYTNVKFIVLDEVDRMLDIGFRDDIRNILTNIPNKSQTIFVSATISSEIEQLGLRYLNNHKKIETASGSLTVSQVDQSYITVESWDKQGLLLHLLTHVDPDLTLVFCRTKMTVDRLHRYLNRNKIIAYAIHGDMPQNKRNTMMKKLRAGSLSVVVASDLAARGLDVTGISHVINYDLPEDPEIYIHRIGRTARAGKHGIAWSFVTPDQGKLLTEIEKLANIEIPEKIYPDFTPGAIPNDELKKRLDDQTRRQQAEKLNRFDDPQAIWENDNKPDPDQFPNGVAPTKPPRRTFSRKFRTRRS